ncbi:MAG: hypothetical protein WCD79_14145, partial [Chthoniobacteraceae bacterium]
MKLPKIPPEFPNTGDMAQPLHEPTHRRDFVKQNFPYDVHFEKRRFIRSASSLTNSFPGVGGGLNGFDGKT